MANRQGNPEARLQQDLLRRRVRNQKFPGSSHGPAVVQTANMVHAAMLLPAATVRCLALPITNDGGSVPPKASGPGNRLLGAMQRSHVSTVSSLSRPGEPASTAPPPSSDTGTMVAEGPGVPPMGGGRGRRGPDLTEHVLIVV